MHIKTVILLATLFTGIFGRPYAHGQDDGWKLKSDRDGIHIYLKSFPDSKYKGVKVECEVKATLSQIVAVIMDVNTGGQWVYSTKSSVLLKQVSPSELYYYSEVSIPWPASNRDFIAHLIASQDAKTKIVTINGPVVGDYVPEKDGIVRITKSEGKWVFTPVAANKTKIVYTLRVDPGGNIPAWLINMFAAKGPYESFKGLKEHLKKPAYANVHLPYIVD